MNLPLRTFITIVLILAACDGQAQGIVLPQLPSLPPLEKPGDKPDPFILIKEKSEILKPSLEAEARATLDQFMADVTIPLQCRAVREAVKEAVSENDLAGRLAALQAVRAPSTKKNQLRFIWNEAEILISRRGTKRLLLYLENKQQRAPINWYMSDSCNFLTVTLNEFNRHQQRIRALRYYQTDGELNLTHVTLDNQMSAQFLRAHSCLSEEPSAPPKLSHPLVGLIEISGVDYFHPEFFHRFARGRDALLSYDLTDGDRLPVPELKFSMGKNNKALLDYIDLGHATAVFLEMARANLDTSFVFYKVQASVLTSVASHYRKAVEDAAKNNVRILNMSMGSYRENTFEGLESVIDDHPEILFVFAAGNDGLNLDTHPYYPGVWGGKKNVLLVGALTSANTFARWPIGGGAYGGSNWGKNVEIFAPGVDRKLSSLFCQNETISGTSFAAPQVAARAATLLELPGMTTGEDLKREILRRAEPLWLRAPTGELIKARRLSF